MHRDSLGRVRAAHPAGGYHYWETFAKAFGDVTVLARLHVGAVSDDGALVEGPGVQVQGLPYYRGAFGAVIGQFRLRRALRRTGSDRDVFVVRLPELVSAAAFDRSRRVGARVVSFLAAEPRSTFEAVLPPVVGKVLGQYIGRATQRRVYESDAVVYVSERFLQELYPVAAGTPNLSRSNVILADSDFVAQFRMRRQGTPLRLVSIGTLESSIKGFDTLIDAVATLRQAGVDVEATVLGAGRLLDRYQARAKRQSLPVTFVGQVERREHVSDYLDGADVYVSCSRSEGLPRATVEAMARGLPVVTTDAGASRELVNSRFVVPIDDPVTLAAVVTELVNDESLYRAASEDNLLKARQVAERANPELVVQFLRESIGGTDAEPTH